MKIDTSKYTANDVKRFVEGYAGYLYDNFNVDEEYGVTILVIDLGGLFKVEFQWTYEVIQDNEPNPELNKGNEYKRTEDWFKIEKGFHPNTMYKYLEDVIEKIIKDKVNYESK